MSDILNLNRATVLVLNRNWQAIHVRTPAEAFCQMATNVATGLEINGKHINARKGNRLPHEAGLKLLAVPRVPKELPVSVLIQNAHDIEDWRLFLD